MNSPTCAGSPSKGRSTTRSEWFKPVFQVELHRLIPCCGQNGVRRAIGAQQFDGVALRFCRKKTVAGMTWRRFFCRSAPLFKCEDRQPRPEFASAVCTPTIEVDRWFSVGLYRRSYSRRLISHCPDASANAARTPLLGEFDAVPRRRVRKTVTRFSGSRSKACPNTGRSSVSFRTSLHRASHRPGKIPTPEFRLPRSLQCRRTVPIGWKRRAVRHRPLVRRRLLALERLAVPVAPAAQVGPELQAALERPAGLELPAGPGPPARLGLLARPADRPDLVPRLLPWGPRVPAPCRNRRAS